MTQILIPDVPTEVIYSVTSSSTGPFTVPFPFFAEEDVQAQVIDTLGAVTDLAFNSGFTFSTLDVPVGQEGSGFEGGAITLNAAIGSDGDSTIRIFRSTVIDRSSNFPNTGPFSMPLLNDEQNKQIMIAQELKTEQNDFDIRAVHAPTIDVDPDMELPIASVRAGFYLRFATGSGDVEVADILETGTTLSQSVIAALLWPQTAAEAAEGITPTNFHEYDNVLRFLSNTVPATTVMDTAFQDAADVVERAGGGVVLFKAQDYKKTVALVFDTDDLVSGFILRGEGSYGSGSVLINDTADVVAIYVDGDITDQTTRRIDRCVFEHFRIRHEAANQYAMVFEEAPYQFLDDISINCNDLGFGCIFFGSVTVIPDSDNFLTTMNNLNLRDYTDIGVRVNSKGHTFEFRNCKVGGTEDGGTAGYFNTEGVHVIGGQWGNNAVGGSIGIHYFNLGSGDIEGGSVRNMKIEGAQAAQYGIVIDGTTNAFISVLIENVGANLNGNAGTIVAFQRAKWCKYINPAILNPTAGGILCEWGQNSLGCELVCDYNASTAPITVHASAIRATKVVTGRIAHSQVANITTDANLLTILRDGVFEVPAGFIEISHNGIAYNYHLEAAMGDDTASAAITPPKEKGIAIVIETDEAATYGIYAYNCNSGGAECFLMANAQDAEAGTGIPGGTTGTNGKLGFYAHTDGKVYLESRKGSGTDVTILFMGAVLNS